MIRKRLILLAVVVMLNFVTACLPQRGGLSAKQQAATDEAMKSLRKIAAAIDVGVTYLQYGPMVIDGQALVNDASALLPEGELKREMNEAMEAYADAGRVWSNEVNSRLENPSLYEYSSPKLFLDFEPGKTLIPKYSLTLDNGHINSASAVKAIWHVAWTHLDNASALLQK